MSEDELLRVLNTSESVKTIRQIRKGNHDEDIIFRDLRFLLDLEKDHYEPKKPVSTFNNNYIQCENMGDKDKNLSIRECIDVIRPYSSDIINNHKTQGEWKIHSGNTITDYKTQGEWKTHLTVGINFSSSKDSEDSKDSKDSDETTIIHFKSDNIEIMMDSETDEIIEELFESLLQRYQKGLQESMKGSHFIFDSVDELYCNLNKISLSRDGSYIDSPKWLKNKKATINPKNNDDKCFQYTLTITLNY